MGGAAGGDVTADTNVVGGDVAGGGAAGPEGNPVGTRDAVAPVFVVAATPLDRLAPARPPTFVPTFDKAARGWAVDFDFELDDVVVWGFELDVRFDDARDLDDEPWGAFSDTEGEPEEVTVREADGIGSEIDDELLTDIGDAATAFATFVAFATFAK